MAEILFECNQCLSPTTPEQKRKRCTRWSSTRRWIHRPRRDDPKRYDEPSYTEVPIEDCPLREKLASLRQLKN